MHGHKPAIPVVDGVSGFNERLEKSKRTTERLIEIVGAMNQLLRKTGPTDRCV